MARCTGGGRRGRLFVAKRGHAPVQCPPVERKGVARAVPLRRGRSDRPATPRHAAGRCARRRAAAAVRRADARPRATAHFVLPYARAWRHARAAAAVTLALRTASTSAGGGWLAIWRRVSVTPPA